MNRRDRLMTLKDDITRLLRRAAGTATEEDKHQHVMSMPVVTLEDLESGRLRLPALNSRNAQ